VGAGVLISAGWYKPLSRLDELASLAGQGPKNAQLFWQAGCVRYPA
jgi:hypothetical protein